MKKLKLTVIGENCIDTTFPTQGRLSRGFVSRIRKEIKNADIVITSHPLVFPVAIKAVHSKKHLLVYYARNMESLLMTKLLDDGASKTEKLLHKAVRAEYELCHAADLILVCSQEDRDNFARFFFVPPDKITIMPNGVFSEKVSEKLDALLTQEYNRKMHAKSQILMVSSYPPDRCGIGAYAYQQTRFLRQEGHHVDVLALRGNGKYQSALDNPKKLKLLDKLAAQYDKVIMQYHPDFFKMNLSDPKKANAKQLDIADLWKRHKNIEVLCHEIDYTLTVNRESREAHILREKWSGADSLIFHTQLEMEQFCEKLNIPFDESKMRVIAHNSYFTKFRDISQREARKELGIPQDKEVYLCIGFIHPAKAFDRAAEVFARFQNHEKEGKALYIVGSVRSVCDEIINYLKKLKQYSRNCENIHLHEKYVSDEAFDTWISACDYVIIPYREIWSSGVLERAGLFDKKCIVRDVGGMKEQLKEGDILFEDYSELEGIIRGEAV